MVSSNMVTQITSGCPLCFLFSSVLEFKYKMLFSIRVAVCPPFSVFYAIVYHCVCVCVSFAFVFEGGMWDVFFLHTG